MTNEELAQDAKNKTKKTSKKEKGRSTIKVNYTQCKALISLLEFVFKTTLIF